MRTGEPLPTVRTNSAALTLFVVLVLGLSWLRFLPRIVERATGAALPPAIVDGVLPILGSFAPLWAALLVSVRRLNGEGVRSLLRQILRWRIGLDWYALAFAGPILLFGVALGIARLAGSSLPRFGPEELLGAGAIFVAALIFAVGEEYGWRGYLQPALQARWPPLSAALVVGAVWAAWHAPLFLDPAAVQSGIPPLAFLALDIGASVLLAWAYNSTAGSLVIVVLAHAATNVSLGAITLNLPDSHSIGTYIIASAAAVWTVAGVLLAVSWPRRASTRSPA
jgi:membrane protease YdiL (CAAX protease family)